MPTMFLLVGPNGAGKSTLYETVIKPKIKAPFINPDLIQKQELDDQSMQGAYKAAKFAEQRRQTHLKRKQSFVSEPTFSHPSKQKLIETAKAAGFRVDFIKLVLVMLNYPWLALQQGLKKGDIIYC